MVSPAWAVFSKKQGLQTLTVWNTLKNFGFNLLVKKLYFLRSDLFFFFRNKIAREVRPWDFYELYCVSHYEKTKNPENKPKTNSLEQEVYHWYDIEKTR